MPSDIYYDADASDDDAAADERCAAAIERSRR